MAIGSYMIKHKKDFELFNSIRTNTDKYKIVESIMLPNYINFKNNLLRDTIPDFKDINEDITIYIYQNVDMTFVIETDPHVQIIKDIIIKKAGIKETLVTLKMFDELLSPFTINKYWKLPPLIFDSSNSNPENFCNGYLTEIFLYIFYTKNIDFFKKIYCALYREENTFEFGGSIYKFKADNCFINLRSPEKMDKFIKSLDAYCDKELIPYCDSLGSEFTTCCQK